MPTKPHFLPPWHILQLQGQAKRVCFPDNQNRRLQRQAMNGGHNGHQNHDL